MAKNKVHHNHVNQPISKTKSVASPAKKKATPGAGKNAGKKKATPAKEIVMSPAGYEVLRQIHDLQNKKGIAHEKSGSDTINNPVMIIKDGSKILFAYSNLMDPTKSVLKTGITMKEAEKLFDEYCLKGFN